MTLKCKQGSHIMERTGLLNMIWYWSTLRRTSQIIKDESSTPLAKWSPWGQNARQLMESVWPFFKVWRGRYGMNMQHVCELSYAGQCSKLYAQMHQCWLKWAASYLKCINPCLIPYVLYSVHQQIPSHAISESCSHPNSTGFIIYSFALFFIRLYFLDLVLNS
jgi:hypothetical protein